MISVWGQTTKHGQSSCLAAISHFGLLRLTAPKNSDAFTFGPSSCCCWQILCQEVAERTVQLHHHQAPGHSAEPVHLTDQGLHAKALNTLMTWTHWTDRPGCDGLLLVWPWNSLSSVSTWVFCVLLCVFSFEETRPWFFTCLWLRGSGGSGNCTNGDPAGLGDGFRAGPGIRHFTCWSLIFSSVKWGELN